MNGRWTQVTPQQALDSAVVLCRSGRKDLARGIYKEVLRYSPSASDELQALGAACYGFGDYAEALGHFQKAAAKAPNNASLHSNIGIALSQLGRFQEAAEAFQRALALDPNSAEVHSNYGDLLTDLQRYEEALAHCRRAVEIDSGFAAALNNLGRVLERLGRTEEAREAYQRALAVDPNLRLASFNLGALSHAADQPQEAARFFERAAAESGDFAEAHYNHALLLLRQGDFAHGFEEYEWRWRCQSFPSPPRNFPQPLWNGSDLAGRRILLHAEQGLGDTIQFVRYVQQVAARSGLVVLEVQPELTTLLRGLPGVTEVVAKGQGLPPFDAHCSLLSLPRVLGTRLDTIPSAVPYLKPDPDRTTCWARLRAPGRFHVGLVWAGNPSHSNDRKRSIPLERFAALGAVEGITWFALQKGPAAAEASSPPAGLNLVDLGPELNDFTDTAAVLANLDLIITVDTAAAHLAGALARPVWTLVPYTPDWRWLLDREDSPWYPTMRLFRQPAPGDWESAVSRVRDALAALVAGGGASEADRRKNVIARKETDLGRWSDPGQLEQAWGRRAALAADFIPAGSTILDLGCGGMTVERLLPSGCRYIPCDLVRRDERTVLCDLNKGELPPKAGATIVTLLGVLEYIYDWKVLLQRLREYGLPVVLSYCPADHAGNLDRAALGWVNHASLEELGAAFAEAGLSVRSSSRIDAHQMLFRLEPHVPLARVQRRVLVLSCGNVGNFGDRLGFHLLNSVLPAQAAVTWAYFRPWRIPEEDYDLVIVGAGNSMYRANLTDELLALVEKAPASIGIFGTQYRESLDAAKLGRLLDRLALWLARYEEDVLLYGLGRKNVLHVGDWLIGQFPLTRWSVDGRLTVDKWVLQDLPLDRTIQKIQQYREVLSERIHPLLCALTSAERVAYREQREDGSIGGRSGKFRSMLLDVFGRAYPEEMFFEVDRDAVAGYRARIQAFLAELPWLLCSLLGLPAPGGPVAR